MTALLSDRTKQALTYGLVTVSGAMLVVAGSRDGDHTRMLAGAVLAVVALGLLVLTVWPGH